LTNNKIAPRDIKRHQQYNKILQACMIKAHSIHSLKTALNADSPSIKAYVLDMVALGFMSVEICAGRDKSNYLRQVSYYTALRDNYPLELMQPYFRRSKDEIVAAKNLPPEVSSTPGHRLISFETDRNLQAKYSATSKMTREQRGFKKAYVSGSILSSAI
jgi:hypothetical protein